MNQIVNHLNHLIPYEFLKEMNFYQININFDYFSLYQTGSSVFQIYLIQGELKYL